MPSPVNSPAAKVAIRSRSSAATTRAGGRADNDRRAGAQA